MNLYEKSIQRDLKKWHRNMKRPPSITNKISKSIQTKTQSIIPEKVQKVITQSIKTMTETIMFGSSILTLTKPTEQISLSESDFLVEKAFQSYKKIAIAQGVGFGAGGILLNLADFPALLSIKLKFLFECANFYGYDVDDKNERLYMLYIFQLAFSSDEYRLDIYNKIMNWNPLNIEQMEMDWTKFQTEYRDYIDLAKLLQLLPVVGAVAGGVANSRLLDKLKITAMNCYRCRYFMYQNTALSS